MALLACEAGSAAPVSDLDACFIPTETLVEGDASIYVAGTSGPSCDWDGWGNYPGRRAVVLHLGADGSTDTDFSQGGLKVLESSTDSTIPVALMKADGGSVVLSTNEGLAKLRRDGSLDPAFGDAGQVSVAPELIGKPISAAAVQSDGKVVVVGGQKYGGVFLARFNVDGSLDERFGGDGTVSPSVPEAMNSFSDLSSLDFDPGGRIIVGGYGYQVAEVMRLLPDGSLDANFGPNHDGFAVGTLPHAEGHVARAGAVFVQANGRIRIYGTEVVNTYLFFDFMTEFDEEGNMVGSPQDVGTSSTPHVETPDGSLAASHGSGRGEPPFFNIEKRGISGSPSFGPATFNLTPDVSRTTSISYSPSDDSLIAAGPTYGINCTVDCESRSFGAIAKVDGDTGRPVEGFGVGGAVLVPRNVCAYGEAPAPAGHPSIAWNRCVVKPPLVTGHARIRKPGAKSPWLKGTINIEGAQEQPYFLTRSVTIRIPNRLRFRAGKVRRKLVVRVSAQQPGETETSIRRRRINIRFKPDSSNFDPYYGSLDGVDPANAPVKVTFRLKRGALKPIPRRLRKTRRKLKVKATYEPIDLELTRTSPSPWFAPNSSSWVSVLAKFPARGGPRGRPRTR